MDRPRIAVLTKIELLDPEDLRSSVAMLEGHCGEAVLAVSAATSANLNLLLAAVWQRLGLAAAEGPSEGQNPGPVHGQSGGALTGQEALQSS
jgi:hypothetical protein